MFVSVNNYTTGLLHFHLKLMTTYVHFGQTLRTVCQRLIIFQISKLKNRSKDCADLAFLHGP